MSTIHDMATKSQESNRTRYIEECIDILMKMGPTSKSKTRIFNIVSYFKQNHLDKEGGFSFSPEDIYLNKARLAIVKNFNQLPEYKSK